MSRFTAGPSTASRPPTRKARTIRDNVYVRQEARGPVRERNPVEHLFTCNLNPLAEKHGAAYRTRTCDPRITNAMLYQLS